MSQQEERLYSIYFSTSQEGPYEAAAELMDDLLRLVSLLCTAYAEYNHNEDTPYATRGMVVTEAQFHTALLGRSRHALPLEPLPEAVSAWNHIRHRIAASRLAGVPLPFPDLTERFGLSQWEAFCVLLALCTDLDRRFERIFAYLQDDPQCCRASLGLAADLYSLLQPLSSDALYAMLDRHRVVNDLFLTDWQENLHRSALSRPLAVPKQLLYQLTGTIQPHMDDLALDTTLIYGPAEEPVLWNQSLIDEGAAYLQYVFAQTPRQPTAILHLYGSAGCGKSFALAQIAAKVQATFLSVEARALTCSSQDQQDILLRRIIFQCLLDGMIPCLDHLSLELPETKSLLSRAIRLFRRYFPLVVLCADQSWNSAQEQTVRHLSLKFSLPDGAARYRFWAQFGREAGMDFSPQELTDLAGRYRLSPAQIRWLMDCLVRSSASLNQQPDRPAQIALALREHASSQLGHLARHLPTPFTWTDLKIPQESEELLRSACSRIRCQYQVTEDWGFARKLPYGRGLSILLYGPPGTGKTMAAQVLSATVGIDLFRVDLSQIVDKYIGETEKNLGRLFDIAQDINCILFFDEADALFSKRTQVEDSKDKYANMETAYLLQRIEQFPGITILATNHVRNFDEAFCRRMTYFVNIPMPNQQTRQQIWESVFPPEIPMDPRIRFDELAEKFEFTGSNIKSVAVSAAYAAAAAGTPVDRRAIYEGLHIEYLKLGKLLGTTGYYC